MNEKIKSLKNIVVYVATQHCCILAQRRCPIVEVGAVMEVSFSIYTRMWIMSFIPLLDTVSHKIGKESGSSTFNSL